MKVIGLFAGVGGLEHGLSLAGHNASLLCESWAPARAVLKKRFDGIPLHGDVATLASLPGDAEVVAAGFPCQDLSQAGMTKGIGGSRSSLVDHVFRILDLTDIPVVVLENVSFMLRLDGGRAMETLTQAFEERGFRWAYRVINSLAFLPQRRERVFFIASRGELEPSEVLFGDDAERPQPRTALDTHAHGFYWTEGTRGLGWAPDAVPPLKNGSTVGIPSPPAILMPNGDVIKPSITDAERLQGFPAGWTDAAASVARESLRWSLVGNAVTVPVAGWLGERLVRPSAYDRERDGPPVARAKWPRAARSGNGGAVSVRIGDFPTYLHREPLHQFLESKGQPLSARATRGFLKRARSGNLRFVPGFIDRLQAHLDSQEPSTIAAE